MAGTTDLKTLALYGIGAENVTGIPAEISMAQAVLEAGWQLEHSPGSNCFGIKEYQGCYGTQLLITHEWFNDGQVKWFRSLGKGRTAVPVSPLQVKDGKTYYQCRDVFATFPTLQACFNRHAILLTSGVYRPAFLAYFQDRNLTVFVRSISVHYSTTQDYGDRLLALINGQSIQLALKEARQ